MIGIYVRLSVDDEDSNSIENQISEGKKYARLNDFDDSEVKIYNEGVGIKGSTPIEKRPALKDLMVDVKSGLINIIWTRKQSRLSRKLRMFNNILEELIEYDVKLYMGDRGLLDLKSPMTKMMLQIMAAFDEYGPNQQSFETKKSLMNNAEAGKVWGVIPYGYSSNEMYPIIVKSEAKVVRRIFNEFLDGKSPYAIANGLNKDNIPTKYNKYTDKHALKISNKYTKEVKEVPRNSIRWAEKTIVGILQNSWYAGTRIYGGKEISIEPIIDEFLFEKVQTAKKLRGGKRTSTPKYNYLLKGLIRCGKCGRNYYGRRRPDKSDNYYLCSGTRKARTKCGNKGINIPALESFLIKYLFKQKGLLDILEKIEANNEVLNDVENEIKSIENEINTTSSRIKKYAKLLGDELIDDELVLTEYTNSQKKLKNLNVILSKLNNQKKSITNSTALRNYEGQLSKVKHKTDFKTYQTAVNSIIENIIIYSRDNGSFRLHIYFKGLYEVLMVTTRQPYDIWNLVLKLKYNAKGELIEEMAYAFPIELYPSDIFEFK
ncbi:recombinase family protein [Gaetbulibacter aestuarii]|uniref:Recombinase family protein n=1 Tax=Gaetbulibacter aestuarii TaxID=1502358 RepID=A0ABW7N422_9FLAO